MSWKYPPGAHDAHERLWDHLEVLKLLRECGYEDPQAAFDAMSKAFCAAFADVLEGIKKGPPVSVAALEGLDGGLH